MFLCVLDNHLWQDLTQLMVRKHFITTAAQIRAHSRESAYPRRKRSAQAASTRACLGFLTPSIVLKRTLADEVANERTRVLGLVRLAYDIELGN